MSACFIFRRHPNAHCARVSSLFPNRAHHSTAMPKTEQVAEPVLTVAFSVNNKLRARLLLFADEEPNWKVQIGDWSFRLHLSASQTIRWIFSNPLLTALTMESLLSNPARLGIDRSWPAQVFLNWFGFPSEAQEFEHAITTMKHSRDPFDQKLLDLLCKKHIPSAVDACVLCGAYCPSTVERDNDCDHESDSCRCLRCDFCNLPEIDQCQCELCTRCDLCKCGNTEHERNFHPIFNCTCETPCDKKRARRRHVIRCECKSECPECGCEPCDCPSSDDYSYG